MKVEFSVPEVINIFKEIKEQPEQLFEMIRTDIRKTIGQYLSELMNVELSHFLGREPYERKEGEINHRNGSYSRKFTLKQIGEVPVKVPLIEKENLSNRERSCRKCLTFNIQYKAYMICQG